jgi:hypothetical protein
MSYRGVSAGLILLSIFVAIGRFATADTTLAAGGSSSSPSPKPYTVLNAVYAAPSPTGTAYLDSLPSSILAIIKTKREYVPAPATDSLPASGFVVRDVIRVETPGPVASPSGGVTATPGPTHFYADITVTTADLQTLVNKGSVDITGRQDNDQLLDESEVLPLLEAAPHHANASVVLINEGPPDSRTENTAFNGPAYVEARLVAELARQKVDAMSISDYLSQSSSGGNVTVVGTDAAFASACALDSSLTALRYIVQYSETTNPLFGTQNGTARLDAHIQRCTDTFATSRLVGANGNARNLGNSGLLFLQYFNLINFGLSSIRKDPGSHGFFGTSGAIVSGILPSAANTAAEARSVGETAKRIACTYSLYLYSGLGYSISGNAVEDNPCALNDSIRKLHPEPFTFRR